MKRFAFLLLALLMVSVTRGQQVDSRSIDAQEGQVWWYNYDNSASTWYVVRTKATGHYSVATFIPKNLVGGEGTTIDGISVYPLSTAMSNVKVWVSASLPPQDGSADLETKDVSAAVMQFNDVAFDKPYKIPDSGLYVGYSFDITTMEADYADTAVPMTDTDINRDGAFCMIGPGDAQWSRQTGNLIVKILFGGNNFNENTISPSDFGAYFGVVGSPAPVNVTLTNQGINDIESIDYTITTGTDVSSEYHADCHIRQFARGEVSLTFPTDEVIGEYEKTLTITKVNGKANTSDKQTATGTLTTLSFKPHFTPVMEVFTGTWCGSCPRALVGMRLVNETYGDKVITISVHHDDPMAIEPYQFHQYMISGYYPNAAINRAYLTDPYNGRSFLDTALEEIVPGELTVSAAWTDDSRMSITINTETTFGMSASSAHYAIGYVLLEDGMKGSDFGWAQENNYAGGSYSDPNIAQLASLPHQITDIEYDYVAVDGWGVMSGIDDSVPSSFEAGDAQKFSYQADISTNTLIQDKSRLSVVALLMDKVSGRIYNGAKTSIGEPGTNAVKSVRNPAVSEDSPLYNLNGQQVKHPERGIYIRNNQKIIVK